MTPLDREPAGQRIARARRRRGLSQAVLAGLVSRSESWLSQVERGKRGVDSHSVLVCLAEVLRVDIEELTGPGDQDENGRRAYPAASLIEQAMMGYGTPGPMEGGEESGREVSLDFLRTQARSAYQAYQATRYDAAGHHQRRTVCTSGVRSPCSRACSNAASRSSSYCRSTSLPALAASTAPIAAGVQAGRGSICGCLACGASAALPRVHVFAQHRRAHRQLPPRSAPGPSAAPMPG